MNPCINNNQMNLIIDPILSHMGGKVSLPGLFSTMVRDEMVGFPALRPHQRPAWHMFLVQLAVLSLLTAGRRDLPEDESVWRADLRSLTPDHEDDAPWQLFVNDNKKPAFLQPPYPVGLKWKKVTTPDELDLLITSRNHDFKQSVAKHATFEDWIFALVSLQTSAGYGGPRNYGIARMNGAFSSRPMLGLVPRLPRNVSNANFSVNFSAWWKRDVLNLLKLRLHKSKIGISAPSLLWCLDWEEGEQLEFNKLDNLFIEVCRRVRLNINGGRLSATRANSSATRINAKMLHGNVDDPWAPVHKLEGKSFTLSGEFDFKLLNRLIYSGDWRIPPLAKPAPDEKDDMLLLAEALARGDRKTEGFKSRTVLVPGNVVWIYSSETAATYSKAQIDEIKVFDKALRNALALMSAGGDMEADLNKHYNQTKHARYLFSKMVDRYFFYHLWHRLSVDTHSEDVKSKARYNFLSELMKAAKAELETALPTIPCTIIRRPRAEVRARRLFKDILRKSNVTQDLFPWKETDVAAS